MPSINIKKPEHEFFFAKRSGQTYLTKAFPENRLDNESKKVRILSRVIDTNEHAEFVQIKNEVVLRTTPTQRHELKITFYEDSRQIQRLVIQKFIMESGRPIKHSVSFSLAELQVFIDSFKLIAESEIIGSGEKLKISDDVLQKILFGKEQAQQVLMANPELVEELVRNNLTKSDIVALAYRKKQLDRFKGMLEDKHIFSDAQKEFGVKTTESTWQAFFESNQWIFGYGLSYLFVTGLDDKKLEQYTSGFSVNQAGKRADALMKTRGLVSALCFVEIKTHETPLLQGGKPYRSECWRISEELAGSIAQTQKTVQKALKTIQTKLEIEDNYGNPTGEVAYLYQPRSFIIIGSLSEFMKDDAVNEQKFGSFELFRRNLANTEIVTFDELYERAKFIVQQSEELENDNLSDLDRLSFDDSSF